MARVKLSCGDLEVEIEHESAATTLLADLAVEKLKEIAGIRLSRKDGYPVGFSGERSVLE